MSELHKLYSKLGEYIDHKDNLFDNFLVGFKALLPVILAVIYKGISDSPNNYILIAFGVVTSIVYVVLLIAEHSTRKKFPVKIVEHLKATEQLTALSEKYNRKSTIDEYIDSSIKALNLITCSIEFDKPICNTELKEGLETVLEKLINHTRYVLDVNCKDFTIATYKIHFSSEKYDKEANRPATSNSLFFFKDDLGIQEHFPHSITDNADSDGVELELQMQFLKTLNNGQFNQKEVEFSNGTCNLILSPIPPVCETEDFSEPSKAMGVLMIAYKGNCCLPPDDLKNTLLIFGRIAANWVAKYDMCVKHNFEFKKENRVNGVNNIVDSPIELS